MLRHARMTLSIVMLFCGWIASHTASAQESAKVKPQPDIEDYATVEAYVGKDETPVYAFGYTYVYGVSPDLLPGVVMQDGNTNPVVKFKPKKSWEIQSNLCGSTPAREPKTMWNDDQPLLPLHLIDGDPETAWSSRGGTVPDRQPEWIRIDLPAETTVTAVALVCSRTGPVIAPLEWMKKNVGKVPPRELTVKLSRDARQWETVYENKDFSGPDAGPSVITFQPRPAKQIWIIANNLQPVGNWGHAFSLGEVEVRDPAGYNLALLSRGAGVQVSSTHCGFGMDRFTQDMLWPIQYDLGFKWLRVGYDMGMYLWSYVEREKGKLEMDRRADEVITEAHRNGVNVILCLDKGNWLYRNPPRKVDWKKARVREMMETYYDHQGWPTDSPEMMAGYLRYVDYMVRHFKGRVAYYEICNESQGIGLENYVRMARAAIPVIKQADPEARIMLGSTGGFDRAFILTCFGKEPDTGIRGGKFIASGKTIAVVTGTNEKDLKASVDARSNAEAGIILRFKGPDHFLLALYANKNIYFHEVVNGDYGPMLEQKSAANLGPTIHLTAEIKGADVKLSVSDGVNTVTTSHRVESINEGGSAGLFHNHAPDQAFDNFRAADLQDKPIFEDSFDGPDGSAPEGWKIHSPPIAKIAKGLAAQVDAIGWHPFYQADPDGRGYRNYRQEVQQFKKDCAALGFKGQYAATEWTWAAPYPPTSAPAYGGPPIFQCSEMQKAKYSAQLMTAHCGMDMISLYNETFQTGRIDWDCTLVRNAFSVDPISPAQPQPIYYVLRSISTVLDGLKAAEYAVKFSGDKQFDNYTFRKGDHDLMIAAWIPGRTRDGILEAKSDLTLPGVQARQAWILDIFNGTEQELNLTSTGQDTSIKGLFIKDFPVFVRLIH